MRLIIKEYLASLKEKDELDFLVADLLFEQGYITDNKPETGNRQFGVDIQAHRRKELLLCVIKQGNLNRQNWDGNPNAVRSSLNEIRDVYIRMLSNEQCKKKIRVAVVINGVLDEAVRFSWEGFVNANQEWEGNPVTIELWNIDKLVDDIEQFLLNEHLFTNEMQSLLRKALYFVEEPDYKNAYFERIIDTYLERLRDCEKKKQFQKEAASLHLATQMIASYAADAHIYKIGVMISEYLIIKYWQLLLEKGYFDKQQYVCWLIEFCKNYEKWSQKYYEAVRHCCYEANTFPNYNTVERKVMLYEVLGYLSTYAYYLVDVNQKKALEVLDDIIELINNNSEFFYPPYDCCIGTINVILRLLVKCQKTEDVHTLVRELVFRLVKNYRVNHKYPTSTDSFVDAVNMEFGNETEEYQTSGMWGMILEWMVILGLREEYEAIQGFLKNDLGGVTKCVWFLRQYEETLYYNKYAMNLAGEGIAIGAEDTFELLNKKMKFIFEQYKGEQFSFETYGFDALEMIVCRYYGYIPRAEDLPSA